MRVFSSITLIICVFLPFLLTFINHRFWHQRLGNLVLWLMACVIFWLLIQGSVQLVEWELQRQLDSFDLDHNGSFSGKELTPQQAQAMSNVISDTGRALAPITGAIGSVLYNSLVFGGLAIFKFNKKSVD